jgi:hypothetical protein
MEFRMISTKRNQLGLFGSPRTASATVRRARARAPRLPSPAAPPPSAASTTAADGPPTARLIPLGWNHLQTRFQGAPLTGDVWCLAHRTPHR